MLCTHSSKPIIESESRNTIPLPNKKNYVAKHARTLTPIICLYIKFFESLKIYHCVRVNDEETDHFGCRRWFENLLMENNITGYSFEIFQKWITKRLKNTSAIISSEFLLIPSTKKKSWLTNRSQFVVISFTTHFCSFTHLSPLIIFGFDKYDHELSLNFKNYTIQLNIDNHIIIGSRHKLLWNTPSVEYNRHVYKKQPST